MTVIAKRDEICSDCYSGAHRNCITFFNGHPCACDCHDDDDGYTTEVIPELD